MLPRKPKISYRYLKSGFEEFHKKYDLVPADIYIRFGSKLYRQIVGIPMGPNCTPLVADLFLFCYERNFMFSLSEVVLFKHSMLLLGIWMTY